MKNLILFIIVLMSLNSCCKEEPIILGCNVENPLEELVWLNDLYDPNEYSIDTNNIRYYNNILYKEYYDGSEYIEVNLAYIFSTEVFDCSGNLLCGNPSSCYQLFSSKTLKSYKTLAPIQ